ncbi:hypothetical protein [Nocardia sp. NPDC058705]|uniref:hypothetical protein n=1 Tax=Nocardia sp. NPDC058705 TaxID=3346609 RepID=UPI0036C26EFA
MSTNEIFDSHRHDFYNLARTEGLNTSRGETFVKQIDEPPLWSFVSQLDFLNQYDIATRNRVLIHAAVTIFMEMRSAHSNRSGNYLRMISIDNWWEWTPDLGKVIENDGSKWLLQPRFWVGNLDDPAVARFRVFEGKSTPSQFTRSALPAGLQDSVYEWYSPTYNNDDPLLVEHVYINPPGNPDIGLIET